MSGPMEEDMKEIGKIIICMVEGFILGKMVEGTKENIRMIENMVMEHIHGLMGDNMMGIGRTENNMELEFIDNRMVKKEKESGKMEKEYNGLKIE